MSTKPKRKSQIDLKKPKYVLPLIILPFLLFFIYMLNGFSSAKVTDQQDSTEQREGLATDIPDVSDQVATNNLEGKFDVMQRRMKNERELSALANISEDASADDGFEYVSAYTDEERALMIENENKIREDYDKIIAENDRVQQTIMDSQRQLENGQAPAEYDSVEDIIKRAQQQANQYADLERDENSDVDPYAENMRIFKEQMKIVDSLQNPDKYIEETNDDVLVPTEQPLEVLNATSISDKFNTIRSNASNEQSIMAIIDDDQNAIAGDRVRIKLLSDIYVGDNLIKKGSYMYAYISGFQTSRVNLMVEQIVYNNRPLRVSLTVYDNDGYMGLYVPSSNFREFTKTLGTQSTRGIGSFQMSQGEDNMAQMGQSLLRRLLSTSGQSLGKLIGRNKVNLKYNYIIYLIDNSKNN